MKLNVLFFDLLLPESRFYPFTHFSGKNDFIWLER